MKNIKRNYFISILALCLLVSFTPPLKKKKVEVKPIATYFPMGGGIIMPQNITSSFQNQSQISSLHEQRGREVMQVNDPIFQNIESSTDSVSKTEPITVINSNEDPTEGNEIAPIIPLPVKPLPISIANKWNKILNQESSKDSISRILDVPNSSDLKGNMQDNDPIRFTLASDKKEVKVGEEIEITIKAELLDISPLLYFTFEELRGYSLRVLMPNGFVQTGGNYTDYISDEIRPNDAQKRRVYTIKGYFTSLPEDATFTLIRGSRDFNDKSVFSKKQVLGITVNENKDCVFEEYHVGTSLTEENGQKYVQIFVKGDDKYLFSNDGKNFTEKNEFKLIGKDFKGYVVSERNIGCPQAIERSYNFNENLRNTTADVPANPFCTSTSVTYPASVGTFAPSGPVYNNGSGCLGSQPDPAWYYLKIGTAGTINFQIKGGLMPNKSNLADPYSYYDVDFICWGPFSSLAEAKNTIYLNNANRIACSYDRRGIETFTISNAQVGKFYMLVLTNFEQKQHNISLTKTGGTGETDCSVVCSIPSAPTIKSTTTLTVGATLTTSINSNCTFGSTILWSTGATTASITATTAGNYTAKCISGACESVVSNTITITASPPVTPTITGQNLLCETCENSPSAFISSNCPSGATTNWKKRIRASDFDMGVTGTSINTKTYGTGTYKVYCKDVNNVDSPVSAGFEVKSFYVTKSPNASEICIGLTNSISLTANNKTADFKWKKSDGTFLTSDEVLTVTAKGDYYAECTALNYRIKISITECSKDPKIVIKSEDGTSLCESSSIDLIATSRDCTSAITWKIEDKSGVRTLTEQSNKLTLTESGKYWALCTGGGKTATSGTITISSDEPSAPTIVGNPSNIVRPNQALLEATGCSGTSETTKWYKKLNANDYQIQTTTGSSFNTSSVGTYVAICSHLACGNSDYSNEITVTESIAVTADKPKVRAIESVTLTVNGCIANNTKIQWKKDGTFLAAQQGKNPITEVGPANYYARCVPNYYSNTTTTDDPTYPWVVAIVGLKLYDAPTVAASLSEAYSTETVNLTASDCPADAGYQWTIKGAYVNQQNPSTTGSGTYYARCTYSGNGQENWSDWVAVTVTEKQLDEITLTGPLNAYDIETVNLSVVGCDHHQAGIQWYIKGGYYWNRSQTTTGPGTYQARCIIGTQIGPWTDITVYPRTVEAISISASKNPIYDNESVLLTAVGCTNGGVQWFINGELFWGQTRTIFGSGFYQARCTVGNQVGPMADINIGMIPPPIPTITANKNIVSPFETVILTGNGCSMGYIQWETPSGLIMSNPLNYTGPGVFRARCYITDRSISGWSTPLTISPAPPNAIAIITSKSCVFPNEVVTLTTDGCGDGKVNWIMTNASVESGRTIDVVGAGTYKVFCLRYGVSGPETSITLSQCQSDAPIITTDKTRARPNEIVNVSLSGCTTNEWYWAKVTYPDNTTQVFFDKKFNVTGAFKVDAACSFTWGLGPQRRAEVFLAPGDGLRVVSNKSRVAPSETAVLTAYGCDFGTLEWKWGTSGSAGNVNPLTVTGPGFYKVHCIDDPLTNSEWVSVILDPSTDIGAIVTGPTTVCPNAPIQLTATACPTDWIYQWKTAEKGWNNFVNPLTVYLPQTIFIRCVKPDYSWWSSNKEYIVDSPFSETFKATNTGPVSNGQTAILTATNIAGATYEWKNPAGVVIATTRIYTIPAVSIEDAGIYTVKASIGTGSNICETIATTDLGINACEDFVLRAKNFLTGEYTNRMPRKPNTRDQFDPLIITIENQDGVKPKFLQPTWSGSSGSDFVVGEDPFTIQAKTVGEYKVTLLSSNGQTCIVKTSISSQPCTLLDDSFKACGTSGAGTIEGAEKLTALSVGDYFNAGDYEVQVTEVTSGGSGIWTGKGYTTIAIKGGIETDVAVQFTNVQINACYQLIAGTTNFVEAQPDPTWGNVLNINFVLKSIDEYREDLIELFQNFENTIEYKSKISAKIAELESILNSPGVIQLDPDIKVQMQNAIDALKNPCIPCLEENVQIIRNGRFGVDFLSSSRNVNSVSRIK
jgi:hypothetical protein